MLFSFFMVIAILQRHYRQTRISEDDGTGRPWRCKLIISACLDRFSRSLLVTMNFTNDYIKADDAI